MGFIKRVLAVVFLIIMVASGASILLLSIGLITLDQWNYAFSVILSSVNYQIALAVAGFVMILIGLVFPYKVIKDITKKRFVTFRNNDGEVVISISAIEEFIKKISLEMPQINSMRSKAFFGRKGVNIFCDVVIDAGANIPETTGNIQAGVKSKLQTMLGMAENINVIVHVSKIVGDMHQTDDYDDDEEQG